MLRVLITGMSGTGMSTVLLRLAERGHRAVDTDEERWRHWVTLPDRSRDWVWRDEAMSRLLAGHRAGKLFVSGTSVNQGKVYRWFDHLVLLSAPAEVLLARIARRTNKPYGKTPEEERIRRRLDEVEPQACRSWPTRAPCVQATASPSLPTLGPIRQGARRSALV